jgi:hypothetical protein
MHLVSRDNGRRIIWYTINLDVLNYIYLFHNKLKTFRIIFWLEDRECIRCDENCLGVRMLLYRNHIVRNTG